MSAKTLVDYIAGATRQAEPGKPFLLASGKTSSYYVDVRKALLADGRAMSLAAGALHAKLPHEVACIGGVPTAGLPLLGALLATCHRHDHPERTPRTGFYTRLEAKAHGTGSRIEGCPGGVACLVEDTVTTGSSILAHAAIARAEGVDVRYALAVLDREQGAAESLRREGIVLLSCLAIGEIL
jgi:orotate phosphoribosyltransferase